MSDQSPVTAAFGTGTSTIPATGDHVATMIFLHVRYYHPSCIDVAGFWRDSRLVVLSERGHLIYLEKRLAG
jgi:hypothetical protein